jgi:hypothetical protein
MQDQNEFNKDNSIDPSFLPKDSNLYVRTMNSDLNNLKSQGGEALPYAQEPVSIKNPPQVPIAPEAPINIPAVDTNVAAPQVPFEQPIPVNQPPLESTPQSIPDFSNINSTIDPTPSVDAIPNPPAPTANTPFVENSFVAPSVEQPQLDSPMSCPIDNTPAVPDYSKMSSPSFGSEQGPVMPNIETPSLSNSTFGNETPTEVPDLNNSLETANLSSDLNNLISPEGFSPIANVDPNGTKPDQKNKLMIPIIALGVLILIIVAYLIIRPSFFKPRVSIENVPNNNLLTPAATVSTTKPSPFLMVKNDFTQSNLNIDISRSAEVVKQITDEAKTLGENQSFKIITPKIKDQFLTSQEILNAFVANAPADLSANIEAPYLLYTYYGEFKPALGIVFSISPTNTEKVAQTLLG